MKDEFSKWNPHLNTLSIQYFAWIIRKASSYKSYNRLQYMKVTIIHQLSNIPFQITFIIYYIFIIYCTRSEFNAFNVIFAYKSNIAHQIILPMFILHINDWLTVIAWLSILKCPPNHLIYDNKKIPVDYNMKDSFQKHTHQRPF